MTSDDKKDNQEDQVSGLSLDDDKEENSPEIVEGKVLETDSVSGSHDTSDNPQDAAVPTEGEQGAAQSVEDVSVVKEDAVLSASSSQEPDESHIQAQDDVDMDEMDDESLEDIESGVHITGDESVDFADEIDPALAGAAKASKGGGRAKMIAPLAVLLVAAGVGGYIVMNPDILSGGSKTPKDTLVPPSITAPAELEEELASLESDMPQPVASENQVPRMPQGGPELQGTLQEDTGEVVAVASEPDESASSVPEIVEDSAESKPFPEDLEEELAALGATDTDAQNEDAQESVMEQGSAEGFADEPAILDVAEDDNIMAEAELDAEDMAVNLTETIEPSEGAPKSVQLAQNDATPPAMPERSTKPSQSSETSGGYRNTVSDVAAQPTEQSKPLIASDSDTYYDSKGSNLPPVGTQNDTAGLRKVDPVTEPASKYVVVNKDREPDDYESVLVAAKRALKLKRYDSALEMYDKLYKKNKRDPRVLMGLAVAQQNSGMTEAALRTYDDLLELDKDNSDAMANMLGLLKEQYPAVALRRLLDLFDDYPRNAMIAAQIGLAYADQGDTSQAFKYLGIASSIQPNNAQHLFNIAIIADRAGKRKDAIEHYEKALEADAVYGGGRSIPRDTIYDRLAVLRR